MAVFELLEGWYNPHRRHSVLGYLSPVNYESKMTRGEASLCSTDSQASSTAPEAARA